jgi:hypothetical protein
MPVKVKVKRLARRCNPFGDSPWGVRLRRSDVSRALEVGMLEEKPGSEKHAERIAYLVNFGWKYAIEVDVGVPVLGYHVNWIVTDGNHRLAAAMFLGLEYIEVSVAGQMDYAKRVLGVDCGEEKELAEVG